MHTIPRLSFLLSCIVGILFFGSCGDNNKLDKKGFAVDPEALNEDDGRPSGLNQDSLSFETQPGAVLLTGYPQYRLINRFKVNYTKKGKRFIGSNSFHHSYHDYPENGTNNWHHHFLPGLELVNGYNMVNMMVSDTGMTKAQTVFEKPVLIKNIYFPSLESDTLNGKVILRDYYLISAYNEDSNKDGFINYKDLRKLYQVSLNGLNKKILTPKGFGVFGSKYDYVLDRMYVYMFQDANTNGTRDEAEPVSIYWISLKNPMQKDWLIP